MLPAGAGAAGLIGALRTAFPLASVAGYEPIENSLVLPDEDDRHVLAAAIVAECEIIVTSNLRDFPSAVCDAHDVLAASVDDTLLLIAGQVGPGIADLVHSQIAAMRRPSTTVEAFIKRLSERAPNAATMIGSVMGLPDQQRILAEMLQADRPDSPQEGVRVLLAALRRGDSTFVAALVDDKLRLQLAPPDGDHDRAAAQLRAHLDDVLTGDGWGFATAWRPQALDVELVKLVQAGGEVRVVREPQRMRGHLFYMRKTEDRWLLVALDGPDPGLTEIDQRR